MKAHYFVILAMFLLCGDLTTAYNSLGRSYYLPNYDLLGGDMSGGFPVFMDVPDYCFNSLPDQVVDSDEQYFENTLQLYTSLSTQTSVSMNLRSDFTLGFTLDSTTQSISGDNRTIEGMSHTTYSKASKDVFETYCIITEDLEENVKKFFENLPKTITDPRLLSSWAAYHNFLKAFGSHVVTEVHYGSSLFQHTYSKSHSGYSEKQFKIKSCADIAGPSGNLNVSVCNGVTKEDIKSVSNIQTSSRLVARGGTAETRSKLYSERSNELIVQFLEEANYTHQPIQYKFTSIWNILQTKYLGTNHYSKAVALEAFYKGYLNYGCQHEKVDREEGGTLDIQWFEEDKSSGSNPDYPLYACFISPEGCKYPDVDCQKLGPQCYCVGEGCVVHTQETMSTGFNKTIATQWDESMGILHNGCEKEGVRGCICHTVNKKRVAVWEFDSDSVALLNILQSSKMQVRRAQCKVIM